MTRSVSLPFLLLLGFQRSNLRNTSEEVFAFTSPKTWDADSPTFADRRSKDIVNGKSGLILRQLRIEQNLKQKVSQFSWQFLPIAFINGFENLVGFFEGVGLDRVKGLFAVQGQPPSPRRRTMMATARVQNVPPW